MKKLSTAWFLAISLGLSLGAQSATAAYPDRPVKLIVGFQPGGTTDALARLLATTLSEKWKSPVVVETKSGSNGEIAASFVAGSKPDGYTLLVISNAHTTSPAAGGGKTPYEPVKSFTPIVKLGYGPMVLLVKNDLPVKTVPELIAYAKANPGKVNAGSSGLGTGPAVALMMLNKTAGLDLNTIPYQGSGPSLLAVIKGEVDTVFGMVSGTKSQIDAGMARPLALTSKLPQGADIPNALKVPTIEEAANLKGFEMVDGWYGVIGPAGMPADLVAMINKSVAEVLAMPDVRRKWARDGLTLDGRPADTFARSMEKEYETFLAMFATPALKPAGK